MIVNNAVLSGFCASAASLFGKLCGLPAIQDLWLLRILFFVLMIVCNAGVWTLFVRALQEVKSSLTATVISAASNYTLSAITGFLFFNEVTGLFWWCGMFFIVTGLLLILQDNQESDVIGETEKKLKSK